MNNKRPMLSVSPEQVCPPHTHPLRLDQGLTVSQRVLFNEIERIKGLILLVWGGNQFPAGFYVSPGTTFLHVRGAPEVPIPSRSQTGVGVDRPATMSAQMLSLPELGELEDDLLAMSNSGPILDALAWLTEDAIPGLDNGLGLSPNTVLGGAVPLQPGVPTLSDAAFTSALLGAPTVSGVPTSSGEDAVPSSKTAAQKERIKAKNRRCACCGIMVPACKRLSRHVLGRL
jgi:hypothetical protein